MGAEDPLTKSLVEFKEWLKSDEQNIDNAVFRLHYKGN